MYVKYNIFYRLFFKFRENQDFKTIMNNHQVAYLCPTTLLSHQQYDSCIKRFKNYGVNIDIVNRHFTNKQVQNKINKLKEGKIDIVFGTHRLLSNDVEYKDLGLVIIDEQHKMFYYRGLKEWNTEKGFLRDTVLSCQDKFYEILKYFRLDKTL